MQVKVLEEWGPQSQFKVVRTSASYAPVNCNYTQDVLAGGVLQFKVEQNYERFNASCDFHLASATLTGVSFQGRGTSGIAYTGGDVVLQVEYKRAVFPDGCSGSWQAALLRPPESKGIFAPAVGGEVPPLVLARWFTPDPNAPCPSAPDADYRCQFAVTAQRL